MNVWDTLTAELDLWAAEDRVAGFWWRDDDATEATPALDRLLDLRARLDVPIAVAVIPGNARPSLTDPLRDTEITILQHGYRHVNHRPDERKKAELGADRELWDIVRELADGRGRMIDLFGDDGWIDVMVPPWNRIDDAVTALLPGLGFYGLTTFDPRRKAEAAPGLQSVNTHIDIIDWPGTREYAGDNVTIGSAVSHLTAKRTGKADDGEATGLLTHHLAHDEACWEFIERFVTVITEHPAAKWDSANSIFRKPA